MGSARKILIVDDNADAADLTAEILRFYGLSVEVAYGGPEGLASAMTLIPDVIFLDIGMPGMDGDAVARVWRGEARMLDVKIVALTAWGDAASRQEPRAAGFDQHFTKPARIDNMLAIAR